MDSSKGNATIKGGLPTKEFQVALSKKEQLTGKRLTPKMPLQTRNMN